MNEYGSLAESHAFPFEIMPTTSYGPSLFEFEPSGYGYPFETAPVALIHFR